MTTIAPDTIEDIDWDANDPFLVLPAAALILAVVAVACWACARKGEA